MKRLDLSKIIKATRKSIVKHAPEILTGIGIGGMVTATVLAVKATPKALSLIEEEKNRQNDELQREAIESGDDECREITKLTPLDTVKAAWKPYIPAVVTGTVSVACLIGASSVNARRNAVLATAYSLSETALAEYKEKVIEMVGEKKEEAIRDKVAKDHIEKAPLADREVILTGKGDALCFDVISGRYFKSDIDKVKKAQNELNQRLLSEMYISLNEFYYELGLRPIKLGNELGWNIDDGLIDLHFSSQLADDGTPCLVVDYHVAPRYGYRDLM